MLSNSELSIIKSTELVSDKSSSLSWLQSWLNLVCMESWHNLVRLRQQAALVWLSCVN